jgi:dipeptidyl-peptidase-4
MDWVENSIVLQQFNRLQNKNTVMIADPKTGKCNNIMIETDKAWVENDNEFLWINKNQNFIWLSERDGWCHAYLVSRNGDKITQITKGNFDVTHIECVDEKNGWLYFMASPDNPTQRYLYRVSLNGGNPELVSPKDMKGTHAYSISPDATHAVHRFSNFNTPPSARLIHLADHKVIKTYTENAAFKKKLETIKKVGTEFFRVKVDQGVELDGWCIKPPEFDPAKKHPVLFYVYGEPAGQTVLDRWDGKRFLWHAMLAQNGYLVMSIDNRGTPAPRGRDWRKSVYRQVGILASSDQANAVKELLKTHSYMDASRIAIWGWSGGGSMTLNAVFRHPDLYKTGMSIAPVPNQRHYDTIYQERYMGLPADNPEGYKNGSPINFAHQLKGKLLLVHGTGDDNCHYLGMETLIDELISHNKQFTMLAYPNRSHSINEGKNTTRHLYDLLTKYLFNNN